MADMALDLKMESRYCSAVPSFTVPDGARAVVMPPGVEGKREYGTGTYTLNGANGHL